MVSNTIEDLQRPGPGSKTQVQTAFAEPKWYLDGTRFNIRIRAETVLEFLGQWRPNRILDIGCGDGSLSLPLLTSQNRLVLLDQSEAMLSIARSRVKSPHQSQVETMNADFSAANLPPAGFDLVICVGVLAYVEQRRDFLKRIKSLLQPGGSLILECTDGPHPVSRLARAYRALRSLSRPDRVRTVAESSASMLCICRDLGFQLSGSYRYCLPLPVLGKLLTQKMSYSAIRTLFGAAATNRFSGLGNECIFHLKAPAH